MADVLGWIGTHWPEQARIESTRVGIVVLSTLTATHQKRAIAAPTQGAFGMGVRSSWNPRAPGCAEQDRATRGVELGTVER